MDVGARMALNRTIVLLLVALGGCVDAQTSVPRTSVAGSDGVSHALFGARATVLIFFSDRCPCVSAHDARIIALANTYSSRGVTFLAIDSEVGGGADVDAARARSRGYPFPILVDHDARIARALGAEYATYSVVVDSAGAVAYRGAFDSDHTHLSRDARAYVREALDDVLAGRSVRHAQTEALGCALRTW